MAKKYQIKEVTKGRLEDLVYHLTSVVMNLETDNKVHAYQLIEEQIIDWARYYVKEYFKEVKNFDEQLAEDLTSDLQKLTLFYKSNFDYVFKELKKVYIQNH